MSTILPFGNNLGEWNTIHKLLQSAANYSFVNGDNMTINGTVCGNVANASSSKGNGQYKKNGTVTGSEWVGITGPVHSTNNNQPFNCQWWTTLPQNCLPQSKVSDKLFVDIATASNTAKALLPTQTFANIDTFASDVIINVTSGLNVINIPQNPYGTTEGKLLVRGAGNLIINGPSDAIVIFNVGSDNETNQVKPGMSVTGGASILTSGVMAQNILFNVLGGDLLIDATVVYGTFLVRAGSDVKGKADILGNSVVYGSVIGDGVHASQFELAKNAKICSEFPAIKVQKLISSDNGLTWIDASSNEGPDILPSVQPKFKFIVTNTGNVPLSNVTLVDNVYGNISLNHTYMLVGDSQEIITTEEWQLGQHENKVTATGYFNGVAVTDSYLEHYVGISNEKPSIKVTKYVSPDNGVTWITANNSPGPSIFSNISPQFKFVVENTGTEKLLDVVVSDQNLGVSYGPVTLEINESKTFFNTTASWKVGEQVNTCLARGVGDIDGVAVTDGDSAYYTGVVATPNISVKKYISNDNGLTWHAANSYPGISVPANVLPQFKFVVSNTGNTALSDIVLTDDVYGTISCSNTLLAGENAEKIITVPWSLGEHQNVATVTAKYDGNSLESSDNAWYLGDASTPLVNIVKNVSVDNGITWVHASTPPGPLLPEGGVAKFQYIVTNTGSTPLTNVTIKDSVLGTIAENIALSPNESQTFIAE